MNIMKPFFKTAVIGLLITTIHLTAMADGILVSWSPNNLQGMTREKFENAKTWSIKDILQKNLEVKTWSDAYLLLVAALPNKDDKNFKEELIKQIINNAEVKLQSTSQLIIWERITSGDILFEGKGIQIDDDLFKVAGRANFILRNITNHNFGIVGIHSTTDELASLQTKWMDFLQGKEAAQYKNPFETSVKGVSEIRSLQAFEALIYSLKPSAEKDTLTKRCLKQIYQLDKMPTVKGSSPTYCNPDTYTFSFLGILIGEKARDEKKDHAWWMKWWQENGKKLSWNKEKGIFEVRK
jgi:hypothetical protein